MTILHLRHSQWGVDRPWHGGILRSMQIDAFLADSGMPVSPLVFRHAKSRPLPEAALRIARGLGGLGRLPLDARALYARGELAGLLDAARPRTGDVLFEENDPKNVVAVPSLRQARGLRHVTAPHNIESLTVVRDGDPLAKNRLARLGEELEGFRDAGLVLAISTFDQAILRLHDIPSVYLPYIPPAAHAADLAAIRARRTGTGPLLVLGSAVNPATYSGMLELVTFLNARSADLPREVVVCGNGTEVFKPLETSAMRVLGRVSPEMLDDLLAGCAAVWAHQAPTTGALTRVVDSLFAGAPVLCNENVSRSYPRLSGLVGYDSLDDALKLISVDLEAPQAPTPLTNASAAALQAFRDYCEKGA